MFNKLKLRVLLLCSIFFLAFALENNFLNCDTNSTYASGYQCNGLNAQSQCQTYAMLRTNSYFSSLFSLSSYMGINRSVLADANNFSANAEFLEKDRPLLIPLNCRCKGGIFSAEFTHTTVKGESFYGISEALEGLTTCRAIKEKNPSVNPWNLGDNHTLVIPLRCACPSNVIGQSTNLLSYPVTRGETVSSLAFKFNISEEAIIAANNRSGADFTKLQSLEPVSTLLLPLHGKPEFGSLAEPSQPALGSAGKNIPCVNQHKRKSSKMWKIGAYIAVSGAAFVAFIAAAAGLLLLYWKKKQQIMAKDGDVELQQLSLSVRTISEKKVSFEGSQDTIDGQVIEPIPHKMMIETYTLEEMKKATADFSTSNLIEDSVFHGRLNGKNLAIKCTKTENVSKIEFGLFHDAVHHHPNIIRLFGTCETEGPDSFIVSEYARNGSLKDWLHGGLAMKSQFISSCYCFLTWNQRLRICLDVATALQYMHQIMNPSYLHRNIKSRNIFIDEEFNAKVGNFGMAECAENDTSDQNQVSCSSHSSSWTRGYLAPELLHQCLPSPSTDIFAFGVVLLEILSGQPPVTRGTEKGEGTILLSDKINFILQSENADELRGWMDNVLDENYSFDQAVTLANLARACVEEDSCMRPNAGEIVEKLSRLVEELPAGESFTICESSCKPLVKASGSNM
uniref:Protein kinase domain-containing protein n=3 Tax=Daucus carota subsp. sativus TaxID=79200 RepID=A0A166BAB6_DAUCS